MASQKGLELVGTKIKVTMRQSSPWSTLLPLRYRKLTALASVRMVSSIST